MKNEINCINKLGLFICFVRFYAATEPAQAILIYRFGGNKSIFEFLLHEISLWSPDCWRKALARKRYLNAQSCLRSREISFE